VEVEAEVGLGEWGPGQGRNPRRSSNDDGKDGEEMQGLLALSSCESTPPFSQPLNP
jgi:hypothetical protein